MDMPFCEEVRQEMRMYAEQLKLTQRKPARMILELLDQAEKWEEANIKMWSTLTKIANEADAEKAKDIAIDFLDSVGQDV